MRAIARVRSRPARVHVAPASVERYTPVPQPLLLRSLASPVPSQTTFAFDGATATAPVETNDSFSVTDENDAPLSVVFIRPPCAAAT